MRKYYGQVTGLFGTLLTAMSIISIVTKGLSIELIQLPLAMYDLYSFIFHNTLDFITAAFAFRLPALVKDLIILYAGTGAVVMRSFRIFDRSVITAGTSLRTFLIMLIWRVDIPAARAINWPKRLLIDVLISLIWPLSLSLQRKMYRERLLSYDALDRMLRGEHRVDPEVEDQHVFVPERDAPREQATFIGTAAVHFFRMTLWRTAFLTLLFVNCFFLWNAVMDNILRGSVISG